MAATAGLLTAQRELDQTLNRIDGSAVTRFTQALRASQGRVFFSGQGRSGLSAKWRPCASCISAAMLTLWERPLRPRCGTATAS